MVSYEQSTDKLLDGHTSWLTVVVQLNENSHQILLSEISLTGVEVLIEKLLKCDRDWGRGTPLKENLP